MPHTCRSAIIGITAIKSDQLPHPSFIFVKGSIADKVIITEIFEKYKPQVVVNLAAQAGVRYSITNPDAYIESKTLQQISFIHSGEPILSMLSSTSTIPFQRKYFFRSPRKPA